MSNPGVITLASFRSQVGNVRRLDIEDNIGEAIHIHLNNTRLALSITDFLQLAEDFKQLHHKLLNSRGVYLPSINPLFLNRMAELLPDIVTVGIESRKLNDLKVLVLHRSRLAGEFPLPRSVSKSPALRYLLGDQNSFIKYKQDAYRNDDNEKRLLTLKAAIEKHGYPYQDNYITLFGDQEYIRDGQHRAAVLAALHGVRKEVPVRVIKFRGTAWRLHPYRDLLLAASLGSVRRLASKAVGLAKGWLG